jgi:hypothetical protein
MVEPKTPTKPFTPIQATVLTMAKQRVHVLQNEEYQTPFMPCFWYFCSENNWIILHLHHTRLFCEPINKVVLEIFWFLFKASRIQTPIVLNTYIESN